MADLSDVLFDLRDESAALDALVAPLSDDEWESPTPAEGWTIAHQIAHLAWTDDTSLKALTDPPAFAEVLAFAAHAPANFVDTAAEMRAVQAPVLLLHTWRAQRERLVDALAATPAGTKVPWFGPPMSPMSMATARMMETFAHGQDVADALGVRREPTSRLRHVAHIGVRTRDFAFAGRGLTPPAEPFRVELAGPSGEVWSWGPDDAAQQVAGPALDFCLLVTQRRHRAELAVTAIGPEADRWLDIAQAFAGPPGPGRPAGSGA